MNKNETVDLLAPSVEAGWRDDFVLELSLIGASGPVIADALAEVEDHCRESGQGAEDAFGPSVEYARALELPDESRWTPAQLLRTATILLLLVFGVNAGLAGAIALANDRRVEISVGLLISGGVSLALMMLVFVACMTRSSRRDPARDQLRDDQQANHFQGRSAVPMNGGTAPGAPGTPWRRRPPAGSTVSERSSTGTVARVRTQSAGQRRRRSTEPLRTGSSRGRHLGRGPRLRCATSTVPRLA